MTIIHHTEDIRPEVQGILDVLGTVAEVALAADSPLYIEEPEEMTRTIEFLGLDGVPPQGWGIWQIQIYDAHGVLVSDDETPDTWRRLRSANPGLLERGFRVPNTAMRAGDYLVISRGFWVFEGEATTGSKPTLVLINAAAATLRVRERVDRARRERREAQREALATYPAIEARRPSWAEDIRVEVTGSEVLVTYVAALDHVWIAYGGEIRGGTLVMDPPSITVVEQDFGPALARKVAEELLRAAAWFTGEPAVPTA